ncbi:hypothetical protein EDD15DRAFT_2200783 [Pisolithus albus]|nr:hypothetical protein EDD15DRAFT_2200783 [Pisolithus albus]
MLRPQKCAALSLPVGDATYSQSETQYGTCTMVDVDVNATSDEESDGEVLPSVAEVLGSSQRRGDKALLEAFVRGDQERSSQAVYIGKRWKRDLDVGVDSLINAEK